WPGCRPLPRPRPSISTQRHGEGVGQFALRPHRKRTFSGALSRRVAALRCKSSVTQDIARGIVHTTVAGWDNDPEKPHDQPGGAIVHRLCSRINGATRGAISKFKTTLHSLSLVLMRREAPSRAEATWNGFRARRLWSP